MSGVHDILYNTRREIDRAVRRERAAREEMSRMARKEESARQTVAMLTQQIWQQNQRAKQYENHIAGLDKAIQDSRKQHQNELAKMNDSFQKSIKEQLASQNEKFTDLLKAESSRLSDEIRNQGYQFRSHIDRIQNDIEQRIRKHEDMAEQWIKALDAELGFIRATYRHELFAPGELREMEAMLGQSRQDLKQGVSQSALSLARDWFHKACNLHDRLENSERIWGVLFHGVSEKVKNVLEDVIKRRSHSISISEDDNEKVDLDIDYWTWNRRLKLEERLSEMKKRLESDSAGLTIEKLEKMEEAADLAETELEKMTLEAVSSMIASVKRNDIQDQIRERLADFGYELAEATLEGEAGDDYRGGHYMKLRNGNGDEIVTVVEQHGGMEDCQNRITFNFYDSTPREDLREERIRQIVKYLREDGIDIASQPRCVPEYRNHNAPDELKNFDRVKQPVRHSS